MHGQRLLVERRRLDRPGGPLGAQADEVGWGDRGGAEGITVTVH
jgi:hypothetical protein